MSLYEELSLLIGQEPTEAMYKYAVAFATQSPYRKTKEQLRTAIHNDVISIHDILQARYFNTTNQLINRLYALRDTKISHNLGDIWEELVVASEPNSRLAQALIQSEGASVNSMDTLIEELQDTINEGHLTDDYYFAQMAISLILKYDGTDETYIKSLDRTPRIHNQATEEYVTILNDLSLTDTYLNSIVNKFVLGNHTLDELEYKLSETINNYETEDLIKVAQALNSIEILKLCNNFFEVINEIYSMMYYNRL